MFLAHALHSMLITVFTEREIQLKLHYENQYMKIEGIVMVKCYY